MPIRRRALPTYRLKTGLCVRNPAVEKDRVRRQQGIHTPLEDAIRVRLVVVKAVEKANARVRSLASHGVQSRFRTDRSQAGESRRNKST
jgi:hypothetical protein